MCECVCVYVCVWCMCVCVQDFPQDKIIAGCSVFIAGHMAISSLLFSIFLYILNHLLDIKAD